MQRSSVSLSAIGLVVGLGFGVVACGSDDGTADRSAKAGNPDVACSHTVRHVARDDQLAAFDAATDWLFPGAMLVPGDDDAPLRPETTLQRAPLTFSIGDQIAVKGPRQATLTTPSLSAYRQALDARLAGATGGPGAANIEWETFGLSEQGQVGAFLNLDAALPLVTRLENTFNWADETVTSRTLMRFTQVYFTVDVDKPATPADLFAADVPEEDVRALVDDDALYVSSISYGRSVLIAYESRHTDSEVNAALQAELGWGRNSWEANAGLAAWSRSSLSDTTFSGYIYGGSATDAVEVFRGLDALDDYVTNGAEYSSASPAVPIAYKFSRVGDNSLAQTTKLAQMKDRRCEKTGGRVRVTLKSIRVDSGDELTLCGLVTTSGGGREATLFDENCQGENTITSGPGSPWESGDEAEFHLSTNTGELLEVRAQMKEYGRLSDSDIQDRTVRLRFEEGWTGTKEIRLKRDDMRVTVVVELTPLS
jgi:hypothetical protein